MIIWKGTWWHSHSNFISFLSHPNPHFICIQVLYHQQFNNRELECKARTKYFLSLHPFPSPQLVNFFCNVNQHTFRWKYVKLTKVILRTESIIWMCLTAAQILFIIETQLSIFQFISPVNLENIFLYRQQRDNE